MKLKIGFIIPSIIFLSLTACGDLEEDQMLQHESAEGESADVNDDDKGPQTMAKPVFDRVDSESEVSDSESLPSLEDLEQNAVLTEAARANNGSDTTLYLLPEGDVYRFYHYHHENRDIFKSDEVYELPFKDEDSVRGASGLVYETVHHSEVLLSETKNQQLLILKVVRPDPQPWGYIVFIVEDEDVMKLEGAVYGRRHKHRLVLDQLLQTADYDQGEWTFRSFHIDDEQLTISEMMTSDIYEQHVDFDFWIDYNSPVRSNVPDDWRYRESERHDFAPHDRLREVGHEVNQVIWTRIADHAKVFYEEEGPEEIDTEPIRADVDSLVTEAFFERELEPFIHGTCWECDNSYFYFGESIETEAILHEGENEISFIARALESDDGYYSEQQLMIQFVKENGKWKMNDYKPAQIPWLSW
ncbi:hypothetical protein Bsel_0833 [[Bacillus] selenitireducens MLS10]|uniref:Lipoprotein n=2 Tax=Salisediminibacterium selenitireducens TaxID=85683 RepID=D6XZI7_BACIE|nr:hypothetical protein Bsel_0833 [[Bacillus] selenitireducens MLS10]